MDRIIINIVLTPHGFDAKIEVIAVGNEVAAEAGSMEISGKIKDINLLSKALSNFISNNS